ncbi:MAG: hypothetical protein FWG63_11435 [Defluviitaleaceae bacterium]|nr:hypothetical protein [Defluviitaleaceae bacterium]
MPNIAKGNDGIIYYADDFKSKYPGKFFCANEEYRIVLLEFKNCNWTPDKMDGYFKIWCYFPYENNKPKPKMFSLKFKSHTIFIEIMKYFCERLSAMKNRGEKTFLVVAGEWNRNSCLIKSKKQIHIVNPRNV